MFFPLVSLPIPENVHFPKHFFKYLEVSVTVANLTGHPHVCLKQNPKKVSENKQTNNQAIKQSTEKIIIALKF